MGIEENNLRQKNKILRPILIILLVSFLLRIWGINHHFPDTNRYFYETEEYSSLQIAMGFGGGDLNPYSFNKPTLYFYLLFIFYGIFYVMGRVFGLFSTIAGFVGFYFHNTWVFYLIGRILSAIFGVASIYVIYLTGKRFFSYTAAIIASIALALTPIHIEFSQLALSDMTGLFLMAVSIYYALSAYENFKLKAVLLSSLFAGLSMSAKYYFGFVFLALFTVVLTRLIREKQVKLDTSAANKPRHSWRGRVWPLEYSALGTPGFSPGGLHYFKIAFFAAFTFLLGFVIGTPFALLDYKYFLASILELEKAKSIAEILPLSRKIQIPNWWIEHIAQLAKANALGIGLSIISLLGVFSAFRRHRWKDNVLFAFIIFYYSFFSVSRWRWSPVYYLLPIIPYLLLLGSDFMAGIAERFRSGRQALFSFLAVFIFLPYFVMDCMSANLNSHKDTKTAAKNWIEANIPEQSRVLMDRIYVPQLTFTEPSLRRMIENNMANQNKLLPLYRNIKSKNKFVNLRDESLTRYGVPYDIYLIEPGRISSFADFKEKYNIEYVILSRETRDIFLNIAPFNIYKDQMSEFYDSVEDSCTLLKDFKPNRFNLPGPEIDIYKVN